MTNALEAGFALDRRWHWLRGDMERSKEPDLSLLVEILSREGTPYAVIEGVALQIHQRDPRTTLDVDIAVMSREDLPRKQLTASGFREAGRHEHSDNWVGPDGTPVQFTDDPQLAAAVSRAEERQIGSFRLRVVRVADLLHEKLRAGRDPGRRRSKRLQDLTDAQSLLEQNATLERELSAEEKRILDELPR